MGQKCYFNVYRYVKWRRSRHLESMTSYQKSDCVIRCVFTWITILPNFSRSDLKRRSLELFLKTVAPSRTTRTISRWVSI